MNIYLAGPDVFLPDAIEVGRRKIEICARHGVTGVYPLDSGADLVVCDVRSLGDPDAATIDALARMQLTARRLGRRVLLRHACADLQDLAAFTGLGDVLPLYGALRLETGRQPEEGKESRGAEEEADPDDPAG